MKTNIQSVYKPALLATALFISVFSMAQGRGGRDGNGGGGGNRGGGGRPDQVATAPGRNYDRPQGNGGQPGRGFDQPRGNTDNRPFGSNDQQPGNSQGPRRYFDDNRGNTAGRNNDNRNAPDQRDRLDRNNGNYNRNYYGSNDRNRNYYDRNYSANRGYNYGNYHNYYNRPYVSPYRFGYSCPYYGQRYTSLNFRYTTISFGGVGYCYYNGIYYRPFRGYYQVVAPPIGININILPFGYTRVFWGGLPYYYYGGTYYRQYDNYYRVVEPPLGAKLPALPRNAEEVTINGQRYFEDNGTYYMEEYNINNERLYTVVGVNGVLDETTVDRVLNGTSDNNNNNPVNNKLVYQTLPANCTNVTINGHEYFRSPDNVYYEAISDGKNIAYQVVSGN